MKVGVVLLQVKELPEVRRGIWKRSFPSAFRGTSWPFQCLGLIFLAYRTVRQISAVLSHPVCGSLLWWHTNTEGKHSQKINNGLKT